MSTNYYSLALMQQMLYQNNIRALEQLQQEVNQLRNAIFTRQKKHRRCDKDIEKVFNCSHCEKSYASDVALKLHLKLKHNSAQKHCEQKSTSQHAQQISISHSEL